MSEPRDDSLIDRFEREGARRYRSTDAVAVVLLTAILLAMFAGGSILRSGEQTTGVQGRLIRDVGRPLARVSGKLGLGRAREEATGFLSPDENLSSSGGGFSGLTASSSASGGIPSVTPEAFSPASIGVRPPARAPLHSLLVTGDSMVMPLDSDLAGAMVGKGVKVIQDPHIGTGISNSQIVDWGKLAASQVRAHHPQAVVLFIGANEGWPMAKPGGGGGEVQCCSAEWAAIYAQRVRAMTDIYLQGGRARVYWITIPDPREAARQAIARVVDAAIPVGVQPWAADASVIDTVQIFTPNGYRDAMRVAGTETIVRESDGIHLNAAGSQLLARYVLAELSHDFSY
jgi:lysophospholipase L1-like esterase